MCSIRAHLFRFCHHAYVHCFVDSINFIIFSLTDHPDCRPKIGYTSDIQEFQQIVDEIRQKYNEQIKDVDGMTFLDGTEETLIDMVDKIPSYYAKPYVRPSQRTADQQEPLNEKKNERREELKKIRAETGLSFKQIRKRERRNITMQRVKNAKHVYPICYRFLLFI
jgi:vacuolar-type H+-ATPase subunit E/Vma4